METETETDKAGGGKIFSFLYYFYYVLELIRPSCGFSNYIDIPVKSQDNEWCMAQRVNNECRINRPLSFIFNAGKRLTGTDYTLVLLRGEFPDTIAD